MWFLIGLDSVPLLIVNACDGQRSGFESKDGMNGSPKRSTCEFVRGLLSYGKESAVHISQTSGFKAGDFAMTKEIPS